MGGAIITLQEGSFLEGEICNLKVLFGSAKSYDTAKLTVTQFLRIVGYMEQDHQRVCLLNKGEYKLNYVQFQIKYNA